MDLFEVLRERAKLPEFNPPYKPYAPLETLAFHRGRQATIEALKEMMVGEPISGHILHFPHDDKPWTPATHFRAAGSHSSLALANGLIDIDGEEVVAMVFRTK